jgi:hypothetical protein
LKHNVGQQWDQITLIVGSDYSTRMELWMTSRKNMRVILGKNCWATIIVAQQFFTHNYYVGTH